MKRFTKWVTKTWKCYGNSFFLFYLFLCRTLSHGRHGLASCRFSINRDDSTIIHKSKTKRRKMPKRMLVVSTKLVNIVFLELHLDEDQAISYYFRVNFNNILTICLLHWRWSVNSVVGFLHVESLCFFGSQRKVHYRKQEKEL